VLGGEVVERGEPIPVLSSFARPSGTSRRTLSGSAPAPCERPPLRAPRPSRAAASWRAAAAASGARPRRRCLVHPAALLSGAGKRSAARPRARARRHGHELRLFIRGRGDCGTPRSMVFALAVAVLDRQQLLAAVLTTPITTSRHSFGLAEADADVSRRRRIGRHSVKPQLPGSDAACSTLPGLRQPRDRAGRQAEASSPSRSRSAGQSPRSRGRAGRESGAPR